MMVDETVAMITYFMCSPVVCLSRKWVLSIRKKVIDTIVMVVRIICRSKPAEAAVSVDLVVRVFITDL